MSDLQKELEPQDEKANRPLPLRLPRPTAWPALLALAVTALAFGVVTSWIISVGGMGLFLIAAGGWFQELRNDQLQ